MKEEPKKTTNIAGLTAEEAYAITFVLLDSLCNRKSQLEARKQKWEAEKGIQWGFERPKGEPDLLTAMVKMQEARVMLGELALDAFGEKVMGFRQRISWPESGRYTGDERK